MAIGDVVGVSSCSGVHYVDTGMYGTADYGAVYVVEAARPALVDTGLGTNHDLVLDALDAVGVAREELAAIALTHVHLDHAGGAGFLAEACPNAEVYVHERGARHLVDPSRLVAGTKRAVGDQWRHYVDPRPVPDDRITPLTDGDRIDLGDRTLLARHAPGHAPHQVVYRDDADDALFVADAAGLWIPAVGDLHPTSPPPDFDLETCLDDVAMLRSLDPAVLLYPHFGPLEDDPDGALGTYTEVLSDWVEAVADAAATMDDERVVERFADRNVRELGHVWGEEKARAEAALNVRGVLSSLDR